MKFKGKTDSSTISGRVRRLGYQRYADYLQSDHWLEIKRRMWQQSNGRCGCGRKATQIHHLTYERLGAERLSDLKFLCNRCHRKAHGMRVGRKRKRERRRKAKTRTYTPQATAAARRERTAKALEEWRRVE